MDIRDTFILTQKHSKLMHIRGFGKFWETEYYEKAMHTLENLPHQNKLVTLFPRRILMYNKTQRNKVH